MPKTEEKSTVDEKPEVSRDGEAQADEKPDVSRDGEERKTDDPAKDLKVVVSLKGGITTVGIQRPGTDPYIESFERRDLADVLDEIVPVVDRAATKWADAPKNPAYSRPSTSGGGRQTRRQTQQPASGGDSDAEAPTLQQTTLF